MATQTPQIPDTYSWKTQVAGPNGQPQQKEYSISKGTLKTHVYDILMHGKLLVSGLTTKLRHLQSMIQSLPDAAESLYQRAYLQGETGKVKQELHVLVQHSQLAEQMLSVAPINMALDVLKTLYGLPLAGYEKLTKRLNEIPNLHRAIMQGLPKFGEAEQASSEGATPILQTLEEILNPQPPAPTA